MEDFLKPYEKNKIEFAPNNFRFDKKKCKVKDA
jgi:hypothetical protein